MDTTRTPADLALLPSSMRADPVALYIARLRPGSRASVGASLRRVAALLGHDDPRLVPWAEMRREHVLYVQLAMVEQHLGARTVNHALVVLRGVLREAWRIGLLDGDVFARLADVKGLRTNTEPPSGRHVEATELRALLAAAASGSGAAALRDGAILALLFGCGLRRAEVAAMNREDVADDGRVRVHGKGGRERDVWLRNGFAVLVGRWLEVRGAAPGPLFGRARRGGGVGGGRISGSGVHAVVLRLAKAAGVCDVSAPDFRRTWVGNLLDKGVALPTVQALAGHSDPATTARYDRRIDGVRREALGRLDVPGGELS